MRSVYNISIERACLRLRFEFGDSTVIVFIFIFKKAVEDGIYLSHIPDSDHAWVHSDLLLLRFEIDPH